MRALVLFVLALAACSGSSDPADLTYRRVQVDLLEGQPRWTVETAARPPVVEVVCPSRDQVTDSGDRLALVLPPPAVVRFKITPEDGEVFLGASAGVHLTLARKLPRGAPPVVVDFEVQVNGRVVARRSVETRASRVEAELQNLAQHNSWSTLGPDEVPLSPGDEVVLRTLLPTKIPPGLGPIPAAFGSLRLERATTIPRAGASPEAPNLVLLVMDTERADRTGVHGYGRPTTPNLAALGERGLVFENAQAPSSWTWPSMASMLTGRPPAAHGVRVHQGGFLAHELETVAEVLQARGFTTGAFVANPLISATHNYDQGFEHFQGGKQLVGGERVVPPALAWLESNAGRRFFLYLHLVEPHTPHDPSPEDLRAFTGRETGLLPPNAMVPMTFELKDKHPPGPDGMPQMELVSSAEERQWFSDVYDACVYQGDRWLGEVTAGLERLGLTDNTVVVYTSDHGEELFDHRGLGHGHELWQELIHVPLVIAGPGIAPGRVSVPVSNRQLGPTLARLGGASLPAVHDPLFLIDVESLAPRPLSFETHEGWWRGKTATLYGLREGDWVLHWALDGGQAGADWSDRDGETRLFNLAADPGETNDLATRHPERVASLKATLARELDAAARDAPVQKSRGGWGTKALIQAIGYASGDEDE
jgi:arylsulfatase A-like enzyme